MGIKIRCFSSNHEILIFSCVLENTQKTIRGVAKFTKSRFARPSCEQLRICFCNTSRVILRFFVLSPMPFFSACYSKTAILLLTRVPAPFSKPTHKQRYIMKMLLWLQPGACFNLQCALNSSQKHFVADFSFFSGPYFCSFSLPAAVAVVMAATEPYLLHYILTFSKFFHF